MQVNKTIYVQIHMIKCLRNSSIPWFGVTLMQKLLQKIPYFANWLILHWFLSVLCVGELPGDKKKCPSFTSFAVPRARKCVKTHCSENWAFVMLKIALMAVLGFIVCDSTVWFGDVKQRSAVADFPRLTHWLTGCCCCCCCVCLFQDTVNHLLLIFIDNSPVSSHK